MSRIIGLYKFLLMAVCVLGLYAVTGWFIDESLSNDIFVNTGRVMVGIIVSVVLYGFVNKSYKKDMKSIKRGIMK